MQIDDVPPVLRHRLGDGATAGLLDVLDTARKDWTSGVTGVCTDRFERRLVEETSKLRLEMVQGFSAVRQEMASGFASLRQDGADQRFEILKWAFLFWVGQFFAVASLMAVAIRYLRL